jgi:hypothetical protein
VLVDQLVQDRGHSVGSACDVVRVLAGHSCSPLFPGIGAAVAHTTLGEPRNVAVNAVLFLICIAVATGRLTGL